MTRKQFIVRSSIAAVGLVSSPFQALGAATRCGPSHDPLAVCVGDITAVEYIPSSRRVLLQVTDQTEGAVSPLYVDDIIKLAQASAYGDYGFSLHPESSGRFLQIQYLSHLNPTLFPEQAREHAERELHRILAGSTVERTLYLCDEALKSMAHGWQLPAGLRLGASELRLCTEELRDWAKSGRSFEHYTAEPYVTYYDIEVTGAFHGFQGMGIRFQSPRVVIRADGLRRGAQAPACVREWADGLTKNSGRLLHQEGTWGEQFRRLQNILLIHKSVRWLRWMHVPINDAALASYQTRSQPSEPVKIRDLPIVLFDRKSGYVTVKVRGGVVLRAGTQSDDIRWRVTDRARAALAVTRRRVPSDSEKATVVGPSPPFLVHRSPSGRTLTLDITNILFGRR